MDMGFSAMEICSVISTDRAVDSRGGDLNPQSLKDAGSFTDGLHWSRDWKKSYTTVSRIKPQITWKNILMALLTLKLLRFQLLHTLMSFFIFFLLLDKTKQNTGLSEVCLGLFVMFPTMTYINLQIYIFVVILLNNSFFVVVGFVYILLSLQFLICIYTLYSF